MVGSSEETKKKRRNKKEAPSVEELRERLARLAEPIITEESEEQEVLGARVLPAEDE